MVMMMMKMMGRGSAGRRVLLSITIVCVCVRLFSPCAVEPHHGSFRRTSSFFFPSSASPSAFWHEKGVKKGR